MRALIIAAALAASATAADAANWIAVCYGQDTQYTQTIGGPGYFHVANENGTYDTQKLVQSYYDGNLVCAVPDEHAPRANSAVAEVCIDKTAKTISVLFLADTNTKRVIPKNASPICTARISEL